MEYLPIGQVHDHCNSVRRNLLPETIMYAKLFNRRWYIYRWQGHVFATLKWRIPLRKSTEHYYYDLQLRCDMYKLCWDSLVLETPKG